jgi:hypothetical protein
MSFKGKGVDPPLEPPTAVRLDRRSSEGRSCGSELMNERSE